jgi:DNA/RNA-binding domain of Phe-tRNA-synthetase-like protein
MLTITATDAWRAAHPGAIIGLLELTAIDNSGASAALSARKRDVEARVRARHAGFSRPQLLALPVMAAYARYYRGFGKTYHALLQLESIVLKGKSLPDVSPAVDANFMAEMETLVLTAGHDAQRLRGALSIDVSRDGEPITQMNGVSRPMPAGDMIMRDQDGVCCSIIYGQDARSPITPQTTHALYVAYAPAGVPAGAVEAHLRAIADNVRVVSAQASVAQQRLLTA